MAIGASWMSVRQGAYDARVEIGALNQTTGLLPETLAAIRMAGGEELLGKMGEAAGEAQKRIYDAARGTGEAKVAFDRLGISLEGVKDGTQSTDAVMRQFIGAVKQLESPTEQAALMTSALGGAGRELNAALGEANLEEWVELTDRFGYDVGPEALQATRDWQAATGTLGTVFEGFLDDAGLGLSTLSAAVNNFTRSFIFLKTLTDSLRLQASYLGFPDLSVAIEHAMEDVEAFNKLLHLNRQALETTSGAGRTTADTIDAIGDSAEENEAKLRSLTRAAQDYISNMLSPGMGSYGAFPEVVDVTTDKPDDDSDPMSDNIAKANAAISAVSMFNDQAMGMITAVGELSARKFGEHSAKTKKIMRDLFYAQKAVAISNIIISGAEAIMRTFTVDPTGVLAAIMSPIIVANTALQVAVVSGESPTFHTGGIVPGRRGLAPDETPITALSGEGVISRRGMAALDRINRGEAQDTGSPIVVYGAQVFDAVNADLMRLPNSSVNRAIRARSRRRVGHR